VKRILVVDEEDGESNIFNFLELGKRGENKEASIFHYDYEKAIEILSRSCNFQAIVMKVDLFSENVWGEDESFIPLKRIKEEVGLKGMSAMRMIGVTNTPELVSEKIITEGKEGKNKFDRIIIEPFEVNYFLREVFK